MRFKTSLHQEMEKCKIRNLKVLKINIWSFYQNILIFKQLERCQNKCYLGNINFKFLQTFLLACSNAPHFCTKKQSVIILWRWQTLEGKILAKNDIKNRFIFLITHLSLVFVNKAFFFQKYTEMKLQMFFIIFVGFFEWQK